MSKAAHQKQLSRVKFILIILIFALLLCTALFLISPVLAAEAGSSTFYTNLNGQAVPNGAVFFIVDGLGSYYLFPELRGETLLGEPVHKAITPALSNLWNNGFRISKMRVPTPTTERGHSVLVTGNPTANAEMVGYTDSSFMDILRHEGFISIGIMQRGDFATMRGKFDVILYDPGNSINHMDFVVQTNFFEGSDQRIVNEIASFFNAHSSNASLYHSRDISERYAGYNRFCIDAAYEVLSIMERYPDQKFIVVVSVGAVDAAGHYRGYFAYLDTIERLDADLRGLIEKCRRNNLFFILTSDHGMSFEAQNRRAGGHSSAKYNRAKEALYIPFVVYGTAVQRTVYFSPTGQQDVAPTLLSLFNIQTPPRFSRGNILPAKETPALYIGAPGLVQVQLIQLTGDGERTVFNSFHSGQSRSYSNYTIAGLPQGNYLLRWESADSNIRYSQNEIRFNISTDRTIDLSNYLARQSDFLPSISDSFSFSGSGSGSGSNSGLLANLTRPIYILLILMINIAGAAGIYYLYRKEGFSKL